ncbi:MAG: pyridoxal phosphate-dependent aminotransferase [Anaerolineae bacterium]|nr:pyridoxal phosphate-dependent aminotransferase [Anaerolineae bacterium]
MQLAEPMSRLGTETAFKVLAKARALEAQGREVIHLEIGEPDFDTPSNIIQAGIRALQSGQTHYVPAAGILPLREAIAQYIGETRGIQVDPGMVVVTPGGKPIMFYAILALINPGDEVLYPNPGFPIYESMIRFVNGVPVPTPLTDQNNFRLDLDHFRASLTPRTRMVILNSPANPTGGVMTQDDVRAVAEMLADRPDIIILSDEIYDRILYSGEHFSITSLPGFQERTIILNGFSKTYAMTGWRLGYGVMPARLADPITTLMINSNSCTAAFTQWAGVEALTGPQDSVQHMLDAFRARREVIVEGLNAIPGIRCAMPEGAFYAFPNIEGTGRTADELADELLQKAGVAVLSGTAFGAYGQGYLRLSYANSIPNIKKALERIAEALS